MAQSEQAELQRVDREIARLKRRKPKSIGLWPTVFLSVAFVGAILVFLVSDDAVALAIPVFAAALAFPLLAPQFQTNVEEISKLERERRLLAERGRPALDRVVDINIENLGQYYDLVRVQTRRSFNASIGAGLLGFGLIVMGLIFGFTSVGSDSSGQAQETIQTQASPPQTDAEDAKTDAEEANGIDPPTLMFVSVGSGVITEFIAGVFFVLYARTVRQLRAYYEGLLHVQNILVAFKLLDEVEPSEKGEVFASVVDRLLERGQSSEQQEDGSDS